MANTLNLGNGNWATKEDSLLAYNSENGNFKPLPFDFTRASSATVVNKDGLIETVGSGEPRIDFKDDANGALLLEPSRSNVITHSGDFSNPTSWFKTNSAIALSNNIALGQDSYTLTDIPTTNYHLVYADSYLSSGTHTRSFYVKKVNCRYVYFSVATTPFSTQNTWVFDLDNNIFTQIGSSGDSQNIEILNDGWVRLSFTNVTSSSTNRRLAIGLSEVATGQGADFQYYGNGNQVLIALAQYEEGSYATSYIPTQESAVTRVADSSSQTPPSGIIGQTEGTLFLDFTPNTDTISTKWLSFLGSGSNYIGIYVVNTSNTIRLEVSDTTAQATFNSSFSIVKGQQYKCAIAYANNDFTAYINGVQLGTVTSGSVPTTSTLKSYYNLNSIESTNTNDLRLYNTRLSNNELQALTKI